VWPLLISSYMPVKPTPTTSGSTATISSPSPASRLRAAWASSAPTGTLTADKAPPPQTVPSPLPGRPVRQPAAPLAQAPTPARPSLDRKPPGQPALSRLWAGMLWLPLAALRARLGPGRLPRTIPWPQPGERAPRPSALWALLPTAAKPSRGPCSPRPLARWSHSVPFPLAGWPLPDQPETLTPVSVAPLPSLALPARAQQEPPSPIVPCRSSAAPYPVTPAPLPTPKAIPMLRKPLPGPSAPFQMAPLPVPKDLAATPAPVRWAMWRCRQVQAWTGSKWAGVAAWGVGTLSGAKPSRLGPWWPNVFPGGFDNGAAWPTLH
jgi:hypothetical protein